MSSKLKTQTTMNYLEVISLLLRDRKSFLQEISDGVKLNQKITSLLISSSICFAIYGAIIGSFHSSLQIFSSALKLPSLYLITLLICLPTLYIFNSLFGSRQSLAQHFAYLLTAVTVIAVLLAGFAPVTLFFLITVNDYHFFLLVNVAIFGLTGVLGVSFLYQVMRPIGESDSAEGVQVRTNILRFWLALYGFVGSQLGWTLRPFFGSPGEFVLFREREGNFFSGVINALIQLLSY